MSRYTQTRRQQKLSGPRLPDTVGIERGAEADSTRERVTARTNDGTVLAQLLSPDHATVVMAHEETA